MQAWISAVHGDLMIVLPLLDHPNRKLITYVLILAVETALTKLM